MPTYDYECPKCGRSREVRHGMRTVNIERCTCGALMVKQIGAPAVHFKGDGFYDTDYRRADDECSG